MARKEEPRLFVISKAVNDQSKAEAEHSKNIQEDPFEVDYDVDMAIRPPLNLLELSSLWEKNTVLGQCYEAMEINIEGFGHRFKPRFPPKDVTPTIKAKMDVESRILSNFFANVSVNDPTLSFTDLRKRKRRDQESTGNAWWEVVRAKNTSELMGFNHAASHTMRFGKLDDEVQTEQTLMFFTSDNTVEFKTRTVWRQFRRIVQRRGMKRVFFKEWGDPRIINSETGDVADASLPPEKRANEVLHFGCVWSQRTPYHMPRTAGNLFSIYGSRCAEETNYTTFMNNMIPSMAILVSNGMLTEGSIGRVKEFTETQVVGRKNYSQFLLLESEPVGEGVANPGTMKLDIRPLTDNQHKDELFQKYDENNRKKVRGAFRLPPMYLGAVEDYNKATAETSRRLADEQVFGPEREAFDTFMNRIVLPELGVYYWTFETNTANTTDNETLVRMLSAAEKTGAMTPRLAGEVMSQVLSRKLEPPKGVDPDVPYSFQLAQVMQAGGVPESRLNIPGANSAERAMPATLPVEKSNGDMLPAFRLMLEKMYRQNYDDLMSEVFNSEDA
jgi:PBSX family phage portal protein